MQLIADKVLISLKNEVVAKQKRIIHEFTVFGLDLEKFFELSQIVFSGKYTIISTHSGVHAYFEYSYQGNEYKYYLKDEHISAFADSVKQKQLKVKQINIQNV